MQTIDAISSTTHTVFWIEAPSVFLAVLIVQPEIQGTHAVGRALSFGGILWRPGGRTL